MSGVGRPETEAVGYQPPRDPSFRGFAIVLILLASAIGAIWALENVFGDKASSDILRLATAAFVVVQSARLVLRPEPVGNLASRRTVRVAALLAVIFFTALATLKAQSLFLPAGAPRPHISIPQE